MEKFLSCDWGTSSFRLKLVTSIDYTIVAEENSKQGIAAVFETWKQQSSGPNRISFYYAHIREAIEKLEQYTGTSLANIPVVISGMASSSIGMVDLPYHELPFNTSGEDLIVHRISAADASREIIIISGAKTAQDVMRGEETQLVGAITGQPEKEEGLFIFPGTHSKHVTVRNSKAITFQTYITGELFDLLAKKSILSASLIESNERENTEETSAFARGVQDGLHLNILHSSFRVRVHDLFGTMTKQMNYRYLSGLLIGTEIRELIDTDMPVTLIGNHSLNALYKSAFEAAGFAGSLALSEAEQATIKGQYVIAFRP